MTAYDASFLALDGPVSVGHVCTTAIFAGDITLDQLRTHVAARLHRAPILRRKLRSSLLGVGRPWWVDDDDFDIDRHLSVIDLGGAASDRALGDLSVRINAVKLDRSRPLWELHLVRGLAGGRSAVLNKLHHATLDGVGGRDLLVVLFGEQDDPEAPVPQWRPDKRPSAQSLVTGSVAEIGGWASAALRLGGQALGAAPGALLKVTNAAAANLADELETLGEWATGHGSHYGEPVPPDPSEVPHLTLPGYAPATPINAAVTAARGYAFRPIARSRSQALRRRTGTTLNDVFIASSAGAIRQILLDVDGLPDQPLVALVPIAAPGERAPGVGNHLALTLCPVPTHLPDPMERLVSVHEAMAQAKRSPTLPSDRLGDVATLGTPTGAALMTQVVARLQLANRIRLPFNVMLSNVPAPAALMRLGARARVEATYPNPPISDGLGLNITALGYGENINVGISTCPDLLPDPWHILDLVEKAHDELVAQAAG
ncbi:MAG: wax ester/triacylglycerol synthase family O-acyltransferase [Dermatophilaceae bacterium]